MFAGYSLPIPVVANPPCVSNGLKFIDKCFSRKHHDFCYILLNKKIIYFSKGKIILNKLASKNLMKSTFKTRVGCI